MKTVPGKRTGPRWVWLLTRTGPADGPRLTWLKVNADAAAIAGLLLITSLRTAYEPEEHTISAKLGFIPVSLWIWTTLYAAAGLLMLYGLIRSRTYSEIVGRVLMLAGLSWQTYIYVVVYGWVSPAAEQQIALLALFMLTTWARVSGLWPRQAKTIILPGRDGDTSHHDTGNGGDNGD